MCHWRALVVLVTHTVLQACMPLWNCTYRGLKADGIQDIAGLLEVGELFLPTHTYHAPSKPRRAEPEVY
jgi:hypothetical protein